SKQAEGDLQPRIRRNWFVYAAERRQPGIRRRRFRKRDVRCRRHRYTQDRPEPDRTVYRVFVRIEYEQPDRFGGSRVEEAVQKHDRHLRRNGHWWHAHDQQWKE